MLTDTAIKNTKPGTTPTKKSDGGGLFLLFNPNGSRLWRLAYRFGGKQKQLALGQYPDVPLKLARERRDEARRLLAEGIDPSVHRQATKAMDVSRTEGSFESVAREWFSKYRAGWCATYAAAILRRLERDIFPWIGIRIVSEINAMDMLSVLRRIEERGAIGEAHKIKRNCGQIFRYSIATGRAERNPIPDLVGALSPLPDVIHLAAITKPDEIGQLMRDIDGYRGTLVVRLALKLSPLVFLRPGELRQAEWSELDLDAGEWRIPAQKMKMRQPHFVPLSRQAIAIFREIQPLTGRGKYVFPSMRTTSKPLSESTIRMSLRAMGYDSETMTAHGFRGMASTVLHEQGWLSDAVERQLAHTEKNEVKAAYSRAEHLPERRKMMQSWADYLDSLAGRNVVPLRKTAAS